MDSGIAQSLCIRRLVGSHRPHAYDCAVVLRNLLLGGSCACGSNKALSIWLTSSMTSISIVAKRYQNLAAYSPSHTQFLHNRYSTNLCDNPG